VQDVMAPADRLEELYRRDGKKLWRSLFAFTGDPQVTDDSIAEAFAEALERGSEIQDQSRWVWKVSFLLASREVRRLASLTEIRDTTSFELPEPAWHLVEALRQLSPKQRLAIVLHDYADRPTDEVAAVLGASKATVYVHLSTGRRRLRTLLEESDD
jgi:RNA polymerase sigma-70 factor (ECF subfamily)